MIMIAYASRTGTKRNLALMKAANLMAGSAVWRLMVSARGVLRSEGFRYALDNGAWTAFQEWLAGKRLVNLLDLVAFLKAVRLLGRDADFIALPDIVMGGEASLDLSLAWLRWLRRWRSLRGVRFMLVVQNGMDEGPMLARIKRVVGPKVGVFVGGDTSWKIATMKFWAEFAHERATICHVGRVNTPRRIRICADADVDSFDGSGLSRFAVNIPAIEAARQQPDMFGHRRLAA
jgi:hypothetical protein